MAAKAKNQEFFISCREAAKLMGIAPQSLRLLIQQTKPSWATVVESGSRHTYYIYRNQFLASLAGTDDSGPDTAA